MMSSLAKETNTINKSRIKKLGFSVWESIPKIISLGNHLKCKATVCDVLFFLSRQKGEDNKAAHDIPTCICFSVLGYLKASFFVV